MSTRAAVAHGQAFVRVVYREPLDMLTEIEPPDRPKAGPFTPQGLEALFGDMTRLFATARAMADLDGPRRSSTPRAVSFSMVPFGRRQERPPPWPIQVTRISLASPLEVVIAVTGVGAAPRFFRALLDLVSELYNVKGHIRVRRAELEAEELAAKVKAVEYERELVRLGAHAVRQGRRIEWTFLPASPDSIEIWPGNEEPPQAEAPADAH